MAAFARGCRAAAALWRDKPKQSVLQNTLVTHPQLHTICQQPLEELGHKSRRSNLAISSARLPKSPDDSAAILPFSFSSLHIMLLLDVGTVQCKRLGEIASHMSLTGEQKAATEHDNTQNWVNKLKLVALQK